MARRFVSIWFRYLDTDWFSLRQPKLRYLPFVLRASSHGRMVITAANAEAEKNGITRGMVLADARAIEPTLEVLDHLPQLSGRLLQKLGEWCIRFTPLISIDPPDGLLLDVTGCSHLWGGDHRYLADIVNRLNARGYSARAAMADTAGAAWAVAHFGESPGVVESSQQTDAILRLPPESLRLEEDVVMRLHKLGLHQIRQVVGIGRATLRRRFGAHFIRRLDFATGKEMENLEPIQPVEPYQERLPCMEPIVTALGIEIALKQLLETLCFRLMQDQKGLRTSVFKGYRVDGKTVQIEIGTTSPSHNVNHLFKLFEVKLTTLEPALGIELFVLEAPRVEEHFSKQEVMWEGSRGGLEDVRLSELMDRLGNRVGAENIHRFLPDEHFWPERSFRPATSLLEKASTHWRSDKSRPLLVLRKPEPIDVTAPIPDYPPMLFIHKGLIHHITKADGPERIEQEWWLQQGQHRDYYRVEDEEGRRYWLFRLGHYDDKSFQWFLHGFFG